jgi:hypothetical protein
MHEVSQESLDRRGQGLVLQISTDCLVGCGINAWTMIGQLLDSTVRFAQGVFITSRKGHNAVAKTPMG